MKAHIHKTLSRLLTYFERKVDPFPDSTAEQPPKGSLKFCLFYAKKMKLLLFCMSLLSISIAIIEVSLYHFLGNIIDWLAENKKSNFFQDEFKTLAQFGLITLLLLPILVFIHAVVVHQGLLGNFPMIIRWLSHKYLLNQSKHFFDEEFSGRLATKVMQTALATREAVLKLLDVLVFVGVYFLSIIFLVAQQNLYLMLPLLFWISVFILLQIYFIPRLKRISNIQANKRADMTGKIVDSYTNFQTLKLFSHSERESQYARRSMLFFLKTVYKQMRMVTGLSVLVQFNNYLLLFCITLIGLFLWQSSLITVGDLAVSTGLALRLNGLSQWIMWELSALFENIGTVADGANTLSQPILVKDQQGAKELNSVKGSVTFNQVCFNYPGQKSTFENLTISIKPGEKIGIVGKSGAGKSSLVACLLRFYDIQSGEILIDNQSIADFTQDSVRKNIGVVSQESSLLHRSIKENIGYGKPGATNDDIILAAKKAEAHEFILSLQDPQGRNGYDVHVGERGVKLSGGQRQRIAIARVILKDAPIVILDEATSALDSEVETIIQQNLQTIIKGKTVIAIAHRLSTIVSMDRLIVLDEGKVVEQGNHEALLKQEGYYHQLWKLQSGGFL